MSDNQITLREFFNRRYLPLRLQGSTKRTVESYEEALRAWESCLGHEVMLGDIDQDTLVRFISIYSQRVFRGRPVTPNTVRARLRHIYAILRFAGPAGYRQPDALGLLSEVPYVRPPRAIRRDPQPALAEDIKALFEVLDEARFPVLDWFPGDWFRGFLAMSLNTALRVDTIFKLDWSMIRDGLLYVPGELVKGKVDQSFPLLPFTLTQLACLGNREGAIFPFPHHRSTFFTELRRLNQVAEIPRKRYVTIHGIRRFVLNRYAEDSPALAQKIAGHASGRTTMDNYVSWQVIQQSVTKMDLCQEVFN